MPAFFLTLDGIDGSGKSTHLQFIREWFAAHGAQTLMTREPGGTEIGEDLRALLLNPQKKISAECETLLMFAARQQHLQEVIRPALAAGKVVISDRFTDATFAYQCGGRGVPQEKIAQLENWVQGALRPDLTILLDVSLHVSRARIEKSRIKDRFELENADFFEKVRQIYLARAAENPARYAVVDTAQDIAATQAQIAAALEMHCGGFFAGKEKA